MSRSAARPVVPIEYMGKWIAWDAEGKTILASGSDLPSVVAAAKRKGESRPIFERVPKGLFVG